MTQLTIILLRHLPPKSYSTFLHSSSALKWKTSPHTVPNSFFTIKSYIKSPQFHIKKEFITNNHQLFHFQSHHGSSRGNRAVSGRLNYARLAAIRRIHADDEPQPAKRGWLGIYSNKTLIQPSSSTYNIYLL